MRGYEEGYEKQPRNNPNMKHYTGGIFGPIVSEAKIPQEITQ